MDQLKTFFAHLIKFRFWYVCGLSLLAVLGNWYMVFDGLKKAQNAGEAKIKGKAGEIDRVLKTALPVDGAEGQTVPVHPNAETQKGMQAEIATATDRLVRAWELRRKAQEAIFVWPTEIIGSDQFVKKFSEFDPPEKFESISSTPEINGFCQLYYQRIQQRMPKIVEIIGAEWKFEEQKPVAPPASAGSGPDGATPPPAGDNPTGDTPGTNPPGDGQDQGQGDTDQGDGGQDRPEGDQAGAGSTPGSPAPVTKVDSVKPATVIWDLTNQQLWLDKMVRFLGRDGARMQFPTGYQVLALQQDLWLLEAMFKAIANVNGEAIANDLVPIKRVYYVVFGREARSQLGKVMPPLAKLAGSQTAVAQPVAAPPDSAAAGVAGFSLDVPPKFSLLRPFHGRYVDQDFQPISIERMFNALTGTSAAGTDLEMIVAKRVPFRIAFRMSESSIPAFIAACSNSPFEFEVAQVRINRFDKELEFKAGTGAADRSSGFTTDAEGSTLAATAIKGPNSPEKRIRDDVDVEFYGVVRIYNPVDAARAKSVAGETVPGT